MRTNERINSISEEEIILICGAIDELFEVSDYSQISEEAYIKFKLAAESAKNKLRSKEDRFNGDEIWAMYEALRIFRATLNKFKAVTRKGTKLFKKNNKYLAMVNRLIPIIEAAVKETEQK